MAKARILLGLVGGWLLSLGLAAPAGAAAPSVKQMLQFQPRQKGVVYSVPAADEINACEVKLVTGSRPGASGWLLLDSKKQPVCRFYDSNGDKKIDVWSYFKDGVEIYREVDTNYNENPDQYRWLNAGGMKWGLDLNEDGKVDVWKMISAEEVAQEVFHACAERDLARLQALFITEAEMRTLKLPAAQIDKIRAQQKEAAKKFQKTLEQIPTLTDKAHLVRVEGAVPHCIPAESAGTQEDVFQFPSRAILFQGADQKHDWLQTGEMLRINMAWRLLDAPAMENTSASGAQPPDPALQSLFERLSQIDKQVPPMPSSNGPHAATVTYNLERVKLVEQIIPRIKKDNDKDTEKERETWIKQLFDNLSTAAQYSEASDKRAVTALTQLEEQIAKSDNSNLAAYGTFRFLWAKYGNKAEKNVQEEWLDNLVKFVQTYPRAEDAADALFYLGMGCEFGGKDEEAKRWYRQLHTTFPEHNLAAKAKGCEDRLSLVGQEMKLTGPMLSGGTFDVSAFKGKVVAVYYWTSYCSNCVTDFAKLKQLYTRYSSKGFELVLVSLDDQATEARHYLQSNPVPGMHLFQAAKEGGGMNSPLGLQYGIQSLPTLFLVGRDGKVLNRTLQVGDLEEALKKAL